VKIDNRVIGEKDAPCFIIAEIGCNHNQDINLAKRLIDAAVDCGVDAVKFQKFITSKLITTHQNQYNILKKLELSNSTFLELFSYTIKKNIIFLATPYDEESVEFLANLPVPAYKIASGDITNLPLLNKIALKNLPIILSTGMSNLDEIKEAIDVIKKAGNDQIILMHCISTYPTDIKDCNLKAITTLKQTFKLPVGFSDHSLGITMSIAAVALGACVIERHFTIDKNLPGPDHFISLTPYELKELVKCIREVEEGIGSGIKIPLECEQETMKMARRSIVAIKDIPQGTTITKDMIAIKRPGFGIPPKFINKIIGKKAKKDISNDSVINWEDIL
jgi:N-acetylneuraminate synthase/N,N'-diacetyllegionaminate synthase